MLPAFVDDRKPSSGSSTERHLEPFAQFLVTDAEPLAYEDCATVSVVSEVEDGVLGVDAVDTADAGQWEGALGHQLGRPVPGEQAHHHVDLLGADREIHG